MFITIWICWIVFGYEFFLLVYCFYPFLSLFSTIRFKTIGLRAFKKNNKLRLFSRINFYHVFKLQMIATQLRFFISIPVHIVSFKLNISFLPFIHKFFCYELCWSCSLASILLFEFRFFHELIGDIVVFRYFLSL